MKPTADESAELKGEFKDWFYHYGYDSVMSEELNKAAKEWPLEYSEACQEWEEDHPDELDED